MAMRTSVLVLRALDPLIFNAPGDTTAMTHGPAAGGRGLEQPLPSTVAGLLASEARRLGLCSPEDCTLSDKGYGAVPEDFHNIHECLRALLGDNYRLYTGLAVGEEGDVLVYTRLGFLRVDELDSVLPGREAQGARRPLRLRHTGVALKPATKTVRPALLYTVEQTLPLGFSYAALILHEKDLPLPRVSRLGADSKTVRILVGDAGKPPREALMKGRHGCSRWVLSLASPALLDQSPWGRGEPVVLDRSHAEKLLEQLLPSNVKSEVSLVSLSVPKTVPGLEVVAPGWCTPGNRPRRPMLLVPAGTVLEVEASSRAVEEIVEQGVGLNTRQGWGTVAAKCIE